MIHSSTYINELPSISDFIQNLKSKAFLDAILMPEWEYRYFSFNNNWDIHNSKMMGSMRNGQGDDFFILITQSGIVGKNFWDQKRHVSEDITSKMPNCFHCFLSEPAFKTDDVSYLFWREMSDNHWTIYPNDLEKYLGSEFLYLDAKQYHQWAEKYYERKINYTLLSKIFNTRKITADELLQINPDRNILELEEEIKYII